MNATQLRRLMYEAWRRAVVKREPRPLPWDRLSPDAQAMWGKAAVEMLKMLEKEGSKITDPLTPQRPPERDRRDVYTD